MNKKSGKTGIFVLAGIALVIIVLIIITSSGGKAKQNSGTVCGNSVGNMYNRGLFCEYDGYIYFSNPADDGTLYKMTTDCTNVKKVYDDKVIYINADGNYLYYVRINNQRNDGGSFIPLYNTGIYRINRTGSASLKSILRGPSGAVLLYGNTLYYQNYDETAGLRLYSIATDGTGNSPVLEDSLVPSSVYDGYLFTSHFAKDRNLVKYKLPEMTESTVIEGLTAYPIAVKTGIFFINAVSHHICRTDYTGEYTVIIDVPCAIYNVSLDGRYIFYQSEQSTGNYIGVYDTETGDNRKILDGNYHNLNVTSKYIFFSTLDDSTTYAYTTDGTGSLKILDLK